MSDTRRTSVSSSSIASVGFTAESSLDVEFRNGTMYRYFMVPRAVFDALMASESKGSFFNRHIRPRFRYTRLGQ